ncbi:hypothetical protein, partial [Vibrio vulnificus]|uniref:hypothetical protein n=1 Tax=Vibrio vulnificus TaxID=672 RepID=UPI0019D47B18
WLLFFLLECDSKLTHYHPNWLNFNSDNYPARGGHPEFSAPKNKCPKNSAQKGQLADKHRTEKPRNKEKP